MTLLCPSFLCRIKYPGTFAKVSNTGPFGTSSWRAASLFTRILHLDCCLWTNSLWKGSPGQRSACLTDRLWMKAPIRDYLLRMTVRARFRDEISWIFYCPALRHNEAVFIPIKKGTSNIIRFHSRANSRIMYFASVNRLNPRVNPLWWTVKFVFVKEVNDEIL